MTEKDKPKKPTFDSKRCPYCSADLPLDLIQCSSCSQKVGKVDRFGRAKEPVDWVAYAVCAGSWLLFAFFVWWGFFRD